MRGPVGPRGWRPALQIARRDARRARGRSALVVAMIALPVLGVTAVDVVARTYQLDREQVAARAIGRADMAVTDSGQTAVEQAGDLLGYGSAAGAGPRSAPPALAAALPPGSRVLPDRTLSTRLAVGGALVKADLRALAYADPLAAGLYAQDRGVAPRRPGEVALTTALARRLGVRVGGRVELPTGPATVVGTVRDGSRTDALTALVSQDSAPADASERLLVDLPGPLTWDVVRRLNAVGGVVEGRGSPLAGAPPATAYATGQSAGALASIGLVVGMALLEVVLLAGPAFSVGAKRQERVLALLAAAAGERRDVRRTVLASGVVLGGAGALAGAVAGTGVAVLAVPALQRLLADVPGPFDVRPLELLAIAAVGFGTAVLAALLPAVNAARQDVLAALTGRRGTPRSSPWVPLAGVAVAAGGTLLALSGARSRSVNTILAGAALAELGLVATTPALVGLAGRLGPLLPAAPRLALRDAARNRARTAPAVAAVLAAVAGSVAVGTYVASLDRNDRQGYLPLAGHGVTVVGLDGADAARAPEVAAALARSLTGSRVTVVRALGAGGDGTGGAGYLELARTPEADRCDRLPATERRAQGCADGSSVVSNLSGSLLVGGADVAAAIDGVHDRDLTGVLDRGGALVPWEELAGDGTATVLVHPPDEGTGQAGPPRRVTVPAAALPAYARQQAVLSQAAAAAVGRAVTPVGVAAVVDGVPTATQEDRARAAVAALAPDARLRVERGYRSSYGPGLLALLVGSAVLVLGSSGIATGLAAADGRADLSTLAAVGASPGLRRRLAAAQSVVTAGLGTVLGAVAGLVPAVGLIRALNATDSTGYRRPVPFPLVVPWSSLLVTLLVVPLLAGLLAALLTRSRLPLVRRVA